jgi:hypothetical protein
MEEPDQQESQRKSNPTADKNDEYYEELIRKLYKPLKIDPKEEEKDANGGQTDDNNHGNTTEPEIPFEVETPQEPEPATQPEKNEPSGAQQTRPSTQGLIKWLTDKINDLIHEPEE